MFPTGPYHGYRELSGLRDTQARPCVHRKSRDDGHYVLRDEAMSGLRGTGRREHEPAADAGEAETSGEDSAYSVNGLKPRIEPRERGCEAARADITM